MPLNVDQKLPTVNFIEKSEDGMHTHSTGDIFADRRVVAFALPGAFTPTCDAAHMPSFIRVADDLRAKGVDEIVCISVNDPHVMRYWGDVSGGLKAGIRMLADPRGEFTKAMGMEYTQEEAGMINRSKRYAMLVEDGVIKVLNFDEVRGVCDASSGETMLGLV